MRSTGSGETSSFFHSMSPQHEVVEFGRALEGYLEADDRLLARGYAGGSLRGIDVPAMPIVAEVGAVRILLLGADLREAVLGAKAVVGHCPESMSSLARS